MNLTIITSWKIVNIHITAVEKEGREVGNQSIINRVLADGGCQWERKGKGKQLKDVPGDLENQDS